MVLVLRLACVVYPGPIAIRPYDRVRGVQREFLSKFTSRVKQDRREASTYTSRHIKPTMRTNKSRNTQGEERCRPRRGGAPRATRPPVRSRSPHAQRSNARERRAPRTTRPTSHSPETRMSCEVAQSDDERSAADALDLRVHPHSCSLSLPDGPGAPWCTPWLLWAGRGGSFATQTHPMHATRRVVALLPCPRVLTRPSTHLRLPPHGLVPFRGDAPSRRA